MQPFAPIILDTVCIIVQFINIVRHFINMYKITSEYFESMSDTEVLVGILQVIMNRSKVQCIFLCNAFSF